MRQITIKTTFGKKEFVAILSRWFILTLTAKYVNQIRNLDTSDIGRTIWSSAAVPQEALMKGMAS